MSAIRPFLRTVPTRDLLQALCTVIRRGWTIVAPPLRLAPLRLPTRATARSAVCPTHPR